MHHVKAHKKKYIGSVVVVIDDDPFFRSLWKSILPDCGVLTYSYIQDFISANIDPESILLFVIDFEIDNSNIIDLGYIEKLRQLGYDNYFSLSSLYSFKYFDEDKQEKIRNYFDFLIAKKPMNIDDIRKIISNKKEGLNVLV